MPSFAIEGAELDLPRNLAILDSNILIALALQDDQRHDEVHIFIDCQTEFILGVPPPVIAEACGFLIGKAKRPDRAEWLLRWLLTPGTGVLLLPAPHDVKEQAIQAYLNSDAGWMSLHKLDYVDAYLMQMASVITERCEYKPDLVIVTGDMRDYLRCLRKGYAYRIHDVSSGETYNAA
ncbi:PIN domain-containing protein [Sinorhizobium fredii]|uniref:PIN domain-containing protein n=1 Tax=Rhizobium fredii TaxID=380 RepID=UPI003518E4DF